MLKRTIYGALYLVVLAVFFVLRQFVDLKCFDILICLFNAISTFELTRALKPYLKNIEFYVILIFAIIILPLYFIFDLYIESFSLIIIAGIICALIIFSYIISVYYKKDFNSFKFSILPYVYPTIFLIFMMLINRLKFGFFGLILVFCLSVGSDVFAYLVGITYSKIRKGKAIKLCPKISPKKTVAGAIGGILGGIIASLIIYFIFRSSIYAKNISLLTLFIIMGICGSILGQAGDLFESLIKRNVGIKDMGTLIPGHGGLLDRIDCTIFIAVFVYFIVKLVIL